MFLEALMGSVISSMVKTTEGYLPCIKKTGMTARGGQHWRRVGQSGSHGKVMGGKSKADEGQGQVVCEGRAKTEGNVGTGHWATGGTQGMMESKEQGNCWN